MRLLKGLNSLGSTALTTTAGGVKTGEVLYKPWGETRFSTGTTPTTWRFTGQREDATIGLYFYNARYYDPALGRFTQPDTIVPQPGNPGSLNRYSYVLNNPLRYTDPTGQRPTAGCEYEGCTLPAGLPPESTWLLPNGAYALVDPQLVEAYDYNPLTEAVLPGVVMLVGVAAVPTIAAEVVVPVAQTAWGQTVLRLGPLVQATWNQVQRWLHRIGQTSPYARSSLPKLEGTIREAFEGEPVLRTLKLGEILYRAEAVAARGPGYWFGTQPTTSAARAERWWNIAKWGNPREVLRAYEVTQELTVYYGRVTGGRGTQILIPEDVPLREVIRLVGETSLR